MKILLVVHTFLPKYIGGTEVCTLELAKEMQNIGHQVKIFCTDPLSLQENISQINYNYQGLKIITIPKDIRKNKRFTDTYLEGKVLKPFEKLISDFRPDIIHYHHLMHLSVKMVDIGKNKNIPQIFTAHDFWIQCLMHQRITSRGELCQNFSPQKCARCLSDVVNSGPLVNTTFSLNSFTKVVLKTHYLLTIFKKLLARSLGRLTYKSNPSYYLKQVNQRNATMRDTLAKFNLVIFPTIFLQSEFQKWGFATKKTILSSDGINLQPFGNFKRTNSDQLRFGYIGSIIPNKGLDSLLKAWANIIPGNYCLKIYGSLETDKKYASEIIDLAKGLKNVAFLGTFAPQNIAEIYAGIDIIVVPSRWFENAPLVLRNALHTKTPVIAVNLGSMPELITPTKNGLLYEIEDINGLISNLKTFIKNKTLINSMKDNFPKQKSITEHTSELIKYYKGFIKNG